METNLSQAHIADNAEKPVGKLRKFIRAIIGIVVFFFLLDMAVLILTSPHYFINDDRIDIHMYARNSGFLYLIGRSGYEVRFDDIANIELLPYSARQLGRMIDDLNIPAPTTGRRGRMAIGRYSGRYRLHVRLDEAASPTIWLTRRTAVPVLISFRESSRTEELYRELAAAWRRYRFL